MVSPTDPLRIFVAMPGTSMGDTAPWPKIKQIEERFYKRIRDKVEELLKKPVRPCHRKEEAQIRQHPSLYVPRGLGSGRLHCRPHRQ